MIINNLNNVLNQSFRATFGPNLQAESDDKRTISEKSSNKKNSPPTDDFFLLQPMLPTAYTQAERERLKQFENDILKGKYFN